MWDLLTLCDKTGKNLLMHLSSNRKQETIKMRVWFDLPYNADFDPSASGSAFIHSYFNHLINTYSAQISIWIYSDAPYKLQTHPTQPRGGHPSHSNLVRGKLTSPTPNPAGDGTSGLTSYPRRTVMRYLIRFWGSKKRLLKKACFTLAKKSTLVLGFASFKV